MTTTLPPPDAAKLKHLAIESYENLCWKCAGDPSLMANGSECGPILFAAEKSLTEFADDVSAIVKRIELKRDVEDFKQIQSEAKKLVAQRDRLEAEFAEIKEEHDARMADLNDQIAGKAREQSQHKDTLRHFRNSAPRWLRDKLKDIGNRLLELKRESYLHPPIEPQFSPLVRGTDIEEQKRLEATQAAKVEAWKVKRAAFDARQGELAKDIAAAEAEQLALMEKALELRPNLGT